LVARDKEGKGEEEEQGREEGTVRVEPGVETVGSRKEVEKEVGANIVGRKGGRV
jgi:hypothetical protein